MKTLLKIFTVFLLFFLTAALGFAYFIGALPRSLDEFSNALYRTQAKEEKEALAISVDKLAVIQELATIRMFVSEVLHWKKEDDKAYLMGLLRTSDTTELLYIARGHVTAGIRFPDEGEQPIEIMQDDKSNTLTIKLPKASILEVVLDPNRSREIVLKDENENAASASILTEMQKAAVKKFRLLAKRQKIVEEAEARAEQFVKALVQASGGKGMKIEVLFVDEIKPIGKESAKEAPVIEAQ